MFNCGNIIGRTCYLPSTDGKTVGGTIIAASSTDGATIHVYVEIDGHVYRRDLERVRFKP